MSKSFMHGHVHTEMSMLDGASRIEPLVEAAAKDGQPALSITDHGNMYGVIPFYKACKASGINPVIGFEAYMAHEHRSERIKTKGKEDDTGGEGEGKKKAFYHLTLLAENNTGYQNLIQLSSRAFLEGYYRKPKIDWEVLSDHSDGVIATTGCLGGHVCQSLLAGDYKTALRKAARFQEIFGRDNLFIEIQDHGTLEQQRCNEQLINISNQLNAPLLATNDSHYTTADDAEGHDSLICLQTNALISQNESERFKFKGSGYYLKSAAEMRHLFREREDSCDNSLWIAERANVEIEFGGLKLPHFPLPEDFTDELEYLRHLTLAGALKIWPKMPDNVVDRIASELGVIEEMGFASYFLIVWDLISHARSVGIRVGPGRGSAAGSVVSYSLGITSLDPIKYDLLFERFLNPSRISPPDIDIDFDSRYRDYMVKYIAEKHGRDHVAQIITFSTIKARAAVRDAARVLGYEYSVGDRIAKAMPKLLVGRDTPLHACFEEDPEYPDGYRMAEDLRAMYDMDPDVARVVDIAKKLENLRRQDGIHAAAVVISDDPLTSYLPIQRKPSAGNPSDSAPIVTQYEMNAVEDLGLLKMDFLALRNLDVISDTVSLLKDRGVDLDIDNPPLDDEPTFEMLRKGNSIGLFQMESPGLRSLLKQFSPTEFEDICAIIALYRPGPMGVNMHLDYAERKNNRQSVSYFHPDAEEILSDTYGLMIYQESMMRVAQKFAGYSLADADNLRKACGKKKKDVMALEKVKFIEGCESTDYGEALGKQLFDIIENFANYAFNRSHSLGYGFIAYQTAYLKANYPVEFFSALLTSVKTKLEKSAIYLNECRTLGIKVLLPDVNLSQIDFAPTQDRDISFGLSAVRNIGEGLSSQIVEERNLGGVFKDFFDFCDRVPLPVLNKRTVEALIKAGAFEPFHSRKGLLETFESILELTIKRRKKENVGAMSLFETSSFDDRPVIPDIGLEKSERLKLEREMLGLYVSDHPIFGMELSLEKSTDAPLAEILDDPDKFSGRKLNVGGVIINNEIKVTRKNGKMSIFWLEDLESSIEVIVFPKLFQEIGHKIIDDDVIILNARVDFREDAVKLIADDINPCEILPEVIPLSVSVKEFNARTMGEVKDVLARFPGHSPVKIKTERQMVTLPEIWSVDLDTDIRIELQLLLGKESIYE